MNSIKKIGMITGFSIVLGAGVFMTNININNIFNDKVVYSDINEKVKEANQETLQKILFSYEEGIKKILHGINLPGITYIYIQNYQIGTFIDERRGGSFDGAVLNFSIRIN